MFTICLKNLIENTEYPRADLIHLTFDRSKEMIKTQMLAFEFKTRCNLKLLLNDPARSLSRCNGKPQPGDQTVFGNLFFLRRCFGIVCTSSFISALPRRLESRPTMLPQICDHRLVSGTGAVTDCGLLSIPQRNRIRVFLGAEMQVEIRSFSV